MMMDVARLLLPVQVWINGSPIDFKLGLLILKLLVLLSGCPSETYQLFDFYHVTEHLQIFADAAFSQESQRKDWFKKARKNLKKGNALTLIKHMDELIAQTTGEHRKTMISQKDYFLRAYHEGRLNYATVSAKKLPIGSGAIESLIRQVVNLRIKGNSKF